MPINLIIKKLHFPNNSVIDSQITVSLYIKPYYGGSYSLIQNNVLVDVDGNILASPNPFVSIDPSQKYLIKAVNESCGFEYIQSVILNPYCPPGYEMAPDQSYCFYTVTTSAIPPSGTPDTLVAVNFASYSSCGSYIYDLGYNINGTGTSSQINLANPFWKNGGTCVDNNTTDGPLNRSGVWASVAQLNQDIGFGVCINIPESKTYYVAIGSDNHGIIQLDGVSIVNQDVAALAAQYPSAGLLVCFRIWHIYPVNIPAGNHILTLLGHNDSGPASVGCEVYDNTSAEIIAATGYPDLNLVFSSKDYVGQQVQIGTQNAGFTCPSGYSLQTCGSPYTCVSIVTTPILY